MNYSVDHTAAEHNAQRVEALLDKLDVTVDLAERDTIWDELYALHEELRYRTGAEFDSEPWGKLADNWRVYGGQKKGN